MKTRPEPCAQVSMMVRVQSLKAALSPSAAPSVHAALRPEPRSQAGEAKGPDSGGDRAEGGQREGREATRVQLQGQAARGSDIHLVSSGLRAGRDPGFPSALGTRALLRHRCRKRWLFLAGASSQSLRAGEEGKVYCVFSGILPSTELGREQVRPVSGAPALVVNANEIFEF